MNTELNIHSEAQITKEPINWARLVALYLPVIVLLFLFLVGVKSLSSSFELMGSQFAEGLLSITGNPFIGLMSGMLATVLVQSSSATSSIIVSLVASGQMEMANAIPMILGANLGTSITNTLVSLGYVNSSKGFERAFAAATVHDFFNILSVAVILPIEIMTGFLQKSAVYLSTMLYGSSASMSYSSPLKSAIKPFSKGIKYFVTDIVGLEGALAGLGMAILSGTLIVLSLSLIVKVTNKIVEMSRGELIESLLSKSPFTTVILGALFTFAVQSSSITTSLLIPFAGAGVISLESIFPVTIGANIGTTATALLASMTGNVHGLGIALVHLLFNIAGTMIWFAPPSMRKVPLWMSASLAKISVKRKRYGFAYIATVFFVLPVTFSILAQ